MNNNACITHTNEAGNYNMDNTVTCRNIFISDSTEKLKENLTQKMAELINQQEQTKHSHKANDN